MDRNKEERVLTESEIQEKKLRAAESARKRRKRVRSFVLWCVVIFIVALVLVWFLKLKKESEAKLEELRNAGSRLEAAVERTLYHRQIDVSGYVENYDTQEARFRSTGAVTGVYVKEGDTVVAGQVLAAIDDTSQRFNLQDLENQIAEARITGAKKQLELLETRKKNYENALDYTTLKASFDGIVASVSVREGDYFEAGSGAITIIDRSRMKTTVEIDEIDMQYISLGQKAVLHFDAAPGVDVEAYVSYIPMTGKYTQQGIGVVPVRLTIDNPPSNILSGFTFSGSIDMEGDVEILLIPSSAVKTDRSGGTTVQVRKDDGTTETRRVTVSYLGEGNSQVLSGLTEGETVVYDKASSALMTMMSMMGGM